MKTNLMFLFIQLQFQRAIFMKNPNDLVHFEILIIKLEEILGLVAMVNKGDELGVDLAPGLQGLYTIKI